MSKQEVKFKKILNRLIHVGIESGYNVQQTDRLVFHEEEILSMIHQHVPDIKIIQMILQ